jgi:lipopolysaccharide/colanic/teichoic acid biosynthesis glycosyltransferase
MCFSREAEVGYRERGKRPTDLAAGLSLFLLTLPVQALVAILSRAVQGRPVFFAQERAGLGGRPFTLIKFRTMSNDTSQEKGSRVTPLGKVLRRSSLDELPQLINVIRGDMSLVGPRPLHLRYNERYTPRQRTRLAVRPGLTGPAQTSGRNALSWEEKFELDAVYVESLSARTDLSILAKTVWVVVRSFLPVADKSTAPSHEFAPEN